MKKASIVLLLSSAASMGAQSRDVSGTSATQITVTPQSALKVMVGTPNHFTGSVRVQSLFDAKAPSHETGGIVTFQPGARSMWHTHPIGQVLVVTEGEGWLQAWDGPVLVMHKGDVIYVPAGVKHWHGGSPTSSVTHIALQEEQNGTNVSWLEPVTDEQYTLKQK